MEALLRAIEAKYLKKNLPDFRPGDTVRVHQKITEGGKERIQMFEGLVIARKHGQGMSATFTLRRVAGGYGVERIFPLHSPTIVKMERVKTSKVRRAKLYYLRDRVGKKGRLKGQDAYAEWSEAEPEQAVTEDSGATEGEELPADDQGAETDGKSGGEPRGDVSREEGSPDSPEKPKE